MSTPSRTLSTAQQYRAGRSPQLFLLAAVLCTGALAWTYYAFVRTTTGQFADESAWREAGVAAPEPGPALEFLDRLPVISVVVAAAVILFVSLARHRWAASLVALGSILGANLTTQVLKNVILDRPDRGVATLDFNSLPSGHTTLAASAVAAVFLVVAPRWRPLAAAAGGTYAVVAGAATFINLWHRPADVVAALLVVSIWTLIGGLVIMRMGDSWNVWNGYGTDWVASRWWLVLCWVGGLGGLTCAAGLYLYAQDAGPGQVPGSDTVPLYFWSGLALIIGVGYLLAGIAGSLFGQQTRVATDVPERRA